MLLNAVKWDGIIKADENVALSAGSSKLIIRSGISEFTKG